MNLKEIENELKGATDGLLLKSEIESPFEFYHAENFKDKTLNENAVLKLAGMPAHYPLKELDLEHFFVHISQARPEDGETGIEEAQRYEQLQEKLRELLQDVKVYRVGQAHEMVLILGTTPEGEVAGLKTMMVEN